MRIEDVAKSLYEIQGKIDTLIENVEKDYKETKPVQPVLANMPEVKPVEKRKRKVTWKDMGIKPGDKIAFREDPRMTFTVCSDGDAVFYKNQRMKLSPLANLLLGKKTDNPIRGTLHFRFKGKVMSDLYDELKSKVTHKLIK